MMRQTREWFMWFCQNQNLSSEAELVQWVLKTKFKKSPVWQTVWTKRNSSRDKESINFLKLKNIKMKRTTVLEKVAAEGPLGTVAFQNITTLNCFMVFYHLSLFELQLQISRLFKTYISTALKKADRSFISMRPLCWCSLDPDTTGKKVEPGSIFAAIECIVMQQQHTA